MKSNYKSKHELLTVLLYNLRSSDKKRGVCSAFSLCKSLCCKSTVFVYTGCPIKLWVTHFMFLNHSWFYLPIRAIIQDTRLFKKLSKGGCGKEGKQWDRYKAGESCHKWRQLSAGMHVGAQRLRRKTTGVDSGISTGKDTPDSDTWASGTLFERWMGTTRHL